MPYVVLSKKANAHLLELARDHGADAVLLDRLREFLDRISHRPATLTEPAKLPNAPNRLMAATSLLDGDGQSWGIAVTLHRLPDEEGIYVYTIAGGPRPSSYTD